MAQQGASATGARAGGWSGRRAAALRGLTAAVVTAALSLTSVAPAFAAGRNHEAPRSDRTAAAQHAPALGRGGPADLAHVVDAVGATPLHRRGITGEGVGVALIDSGTVPVAGLAGTEIVDGPDLSFESQAEPLRHLDTYGHGTHMAGIIAADGAGLTGVAPDARLVSIKVAQADGMTDVSQVIAAIDWVVAHRNDPGLNIRVLNLSFGTDGLQDYQLDPLAHAAEVAWRHGIVVVVAGGNDGAGSAQLNNPATDPYVLAVGAADTKGTRSPADDRVAEFSSRGTAARSVDLVAPGSRIASLRVPGSFLDESFPGARAGNALFRGSGTSQAAAAVSGAAALLLQQRPELTPDQVKGLLTDSARVLRGEDELAAGAGMLDVGRAATRRTPQVAQAWPVSTGLGSLEAARGSSHVRINGVELIGERGLFGDWDAATWAAAAEAQTSWDGDTWNGDLWIGTWPEPTWTTGSWLAEDWAGGLWRGGLWRGGLWRGGLWRGGLWRGGLWRGEVWQGDVWQGGLWRSDVGV